MKQKQLNLNKKQLIQNIVTCLTPTEISKPYNFFIRDGLSVMFGREDGQAYQAALDILLSFDELTDKYTPKTITAGFQSLLVKFLAREDGGPSEEEIKDELNKWLLEMISVEESQFRYFMVADNLKIHQKELVIGKVKLEPLSEKNIQGLIDRIHARIDEKKYYRDKPEEGEAVKQGIEKEIFTQFTPCEYSTLMSIGLFVRDVDKESEAANSNFQDVLHLLRFLGMFAYKKSHKAEIGLKGELAQGFFAYLALADDNRWKIHQEPSGYQFQFEITSENLALFKNAGLDTYSEILSKHNNERIEIDARIINSIIWISKAISDSSEYNQFIQYCIAIETLLGGDMREGMTRILAERLAFLLTDEPNKRMEVYENAMKIFNIRGQLVHEGRPDKENEFVKYLPFVASYASQAIVLTTKLRNKYSWGKFSDLADYFQELKFTNVTSQVTEGIG